MKIIKLSYPAIFEIAEDGINVSFPDIPGCFTCGFTKQEALQMAKDALELMLHGTPLDAVPKHTTLLETQIQNNSIYIEQITVDMKVCDNKLVGRNVIDIK